MMDLEIENKKTENCGDMKVRNENIFPRYHFDFARVPFKILL